MKPFYILKYRGNWWKWRKKLSLWNYFEYKRKYFKSSNL